MQNRWHLFLVAQRLWEVSSVKSIIAGSFLAEISFWASVGLLTAVTMYGFVNQALQEFVIRESSFETWEEILYVSLCLQISICKSAIGSKAIERSDFRQSKSIDVNNNVTNCSLAIDCIPWFLPCRKKANLDLGETGEFNQRRIYDDQNTFDLLRVASEVLGEHTTVSVYRICPLFRAPRGVSEFLRSRLLCVIILCENFHFLNSEVIIATLSITIRMGFNPTPNLRDLFGRPERTSVVVYIEFSTCKKFQRPVKINEWLSWTTKNVVVLLWMNTLLNKQTKIF